MSNIYRKSSIEKLSNPEQLDRVITITSPLSWIALIGVVIIIAVTVVWSIKGTMPSTQTVNGIVADPDSVSAFYSPNSGTVVRIMKNSGNYVKKGDDLIVVKSKTGKEFTIKANEDGRITDCLVEEESFLYSGSEVMRYTPDIPQEQVVVCYVRVAASKSLKKDMKVLLYPMSVDSQKYGHMEASIESVGEFPVSAVNLSYVLGADNMMSDVFLNQGPVVSVICRIKPDNKTKSGYFWSSKNGGDLTISNGTFITAKIVTDESAPITKLFGNLKEKMGD